MLTTYFRLTEEVIYESIDARTEVLAALRELGPPDLVQLIKQAPRSPGKQVCYPQILLPSLFALSAIY